MRHPLLLTGFLLMMPLAAHAQVTIDLRALDALPGGASGGAPSPPRLPPHVVLRTVPPGPATTAALPIPPSTPHGPPPISGPGNPPGMPPTTAQTPGQAVGQTTGPTPPATPAPPTPPPATLPTGAPAIASLAPIPPPAVPTTAAPPAPPPITATAGTIAAPESTGLRLIFKPDESDLSPASNSAIGELVKSSPSGDTITFNVVAYAAGVVDDPSIARRLSLARGLSVRAALLTDGVPSTHIYVRALGASTGDGPPNRVDLTVLGTSGAATAGAAGAPKP